MINAERLECMVIAIHDSVDHLLKGHHMQDASQLTTKHMSKENLVYAFFVALWYMFGHWARVIDIRFWGLCVPTSN